MPVKNRFIEEETGQQPSIPNESPIGNKNFSPIPNKILNQCNESGKKELKLFDSEWYPQGINYLSAQKYKNQLSNSMFKPDAGD